MVRWRSFQVHNLSPNPKTNTIIQLGTRPNQSIIWKLGPRPSQNCYFATIWAFRENLFAQITWHHLVTTDIQLCYKTCTYCTHTAFPLRSAPIDHLKCGSQTICPSGEHIKIFILCCVSGICQRCVGGGVQVMIFEAEQTILRFCPVALELPCNHFGHNHRFSLIKLLF